MTAQAIAILNLPLILTGAVTAHRFVTPVGTQAGAGINTLGVARTDGALGEMIPVDVLGTAVVEAGGAISLGATIKSDADGKAIVWATSGAKVALALQPASAAGQLVEVLLIANAS